MATVPSRQDVYMALFALLIDTPGFTSVSTRMIMPVQVALQDQPTLRLWRGFEETIYEANRLPVDLWEAAAVIYIINENKNISGMDIMNPLIDAVRYVLRPDDYINNANTLGLGIQGLWARVEGVSAVEPGDTDPKGIGTAIIPIKITVPRA